MKRITSLALSAALLASLSTPVLAAPAISVDASPTAAVLEEENSLWELPQADTPDMSNTVWSFAGGYIDGSEMTQAEMDESLAVSYTHLDVYKRQVPALGLPPTASSAQTFQST